MGAALETGNRRAGKQKSGKTGKRETRELVAPRVGEDSEKFAIEFAT